MSGRCSGDLGKDPPQLTVGELAFDTQKKVMGVVMDITWGPVYLRPLRGGVEWTARREDVRPATILDQIRPALNELNLRSSRGGV